MPKSELKPLSNIVISELNFVDKTAYWRVVCNIVEKYSSLDGFFISQRIIDQDETEQYIFIEPIYKSYFSDNIIFEQNYHSTKSKSGNVLDFELHCNIILDFYNNLFKNHSEIIPFCSSYFTYEHYLYYQFPEILNLILNHNKDDTQIPDSNFYIYNKILKIRIKKVGDNFLYSAQFFCLNLQERPLWEFSNQDLLNNNNNNKHQFKVNIPCYYSPKEIQRNYGKYSNFNIDTYCDAVKKIQLAITEGKVYQVNLTQKLKIPKSTTYKAILLNILYTNIDLRLCFLTFNFQDISISCMCASPELMLENNDGDIFSMPIKGSRYNDNLNNRNLNLEEELFNSPKDLAELFIIIDLIRNDLSKISNFGTIKVKTNFHLTLHSSMIHLESIIQSRLKNNIKYFEVLNSLSPYGSITGAPKKEVAKTISEIENTDRGIYTGCIGFLGSKKFMHFSVAIRTAVFTKEYIQLQGGGGITIDSNPHEEYYESLSKLSWFFSLLNKP